MKRISISAILLLFILSITAFSQAKTDNTKIDRMLIRGEFKRAIDTCKLIVSTDTLNSEIYYKLGLAYQNMMADDKAFRCFRIASQLSPDNDNYSFTVAKGLFNRGKTQQAKPILLKLCVADTSNWAYAYYLTAIYMQEDRYDDAIKVYDRFYRSDSTNPVYIDKIGFACLQKEDFEKGIMMFKKSLSINPVNLNAIKNLAYLTASTSADTALQILTKGIQIDSTDMDLYARRAAIRFTIFDFKEASMDYIKLINSGDSSLFNLKRAGIARANVNESKEAIPYLLRAYKKDTSDYTVLSYLARHYESLKEFKKSEYYSRALIKVLNPVTGQLGLNHLLLAEVLKKDGRYTEAVTEYLKSQEFRSDNSVYMIIANLYDEKLNNTSKAIYYYELYLNKIRKNKDEYESDYNNSIRKRVESLKNPKPANKVYSIKDKK